MTRTKILMETIRLYMSEAHDDFGFHFEDSWFMVLQESDVVIPLTKSKAEELSRLWDVQIIVMKKPQ